MRTHAEIRKAIDTEMRQSPKTARVSKVEEEVRASGCPEGMIKETVREVIYQDELKPKEGTAWAYWDNERKEFLFVYCCEAAVRMCDPDSFRREEKAGKGKVMKVKLIEDRS